MPLRPWSPIPIADHGEPLLELPADFVRPEPHPYVPAGAPYASPAPPFLLVPARFYRFVARPPHPKSPHPLRRL